MASSRLTARDCEALVLRAISRITPEYGTWSSEAQERYRAALPEEDRSFLVRELLKILHGVDASTDDEVDAVAADFDDAQRLQWNSIFTCLYGIGDDRCVLFENLEDRSLRDFETLYDYDYHQYSLYAQRRRCEEPDCVVEPYRGVLHARWLRLFIDGDFFCAILYTAASYLCEHMLDWGDDIIEELVPHRYVDGEDHGKPEGDEFVWDRRIDAGGREEQLEELRYRYWQYIDSRLDALKAEFDASATGEVIFLNAVVEPRPQVDIVFSDKTALQGVRFRHFVRDCRHRLGDPQVFGRLVERERQAARTYLEENYRDIVDHFDPKVVRSRRKVRLLVSKDAAKDFL